MSWKGDFEGVLGKIKHLAKFTLNKAFLDDFGRALSDEKNRIDKRTRGGRDRDGHPFLKYSPAYRKYKVSRGRDTKANLEFTGSMLQAMQIKVESTSNGAEGSVFISGAEGKKARRHIEGDGVPVRNFLGFTKQFHDNLNRLIRKHFNG